jgi:ABC-type antimicrobial peptide transport system ATPase subunit
MPSNVPAEVAGLLAEMETELSMLRGVIQGIGMELMDMTGKDQRLFHRGHLVYYDIVRQSYVVDHTIPMTFQETCAFLELSPDSRVATLITQLRPIAPPALQLVK